MIKLSENRTLLLNLGATIHELDDIATLIGYYSTDKPGPAYCTFTNVQGFGELMIQLDRKIMVLALRQQKQSLLDALTALGIEE